MAAITLLPTVFSGPVITLQMTIKLPDQSWPDSPITEAEGSPPPPSCSSEIPPKPSPVTTILINLKVIRGRAVLKPLSTKVQANVLLISLCGHLLQSVTYRYREFPVPGIFHFFGGFGTGIGTNWYQKKVSEPVSEKFGTGKSLATGIGKIWYRKKSRNRYRNKFDTGTDFRRKKFRNFEDL